MGDNHNRNRVDRPAKEVIKSSSLARVYFRLPPFIDLNFCENNNINAMKFILNNPKFLNISVFGKNLIFSLMNDEIKIY